MDQPVCIIAGSKTDESVIMGAVKILNEMKVPFSNHVCSAHRDPERLRGIVTEAENGGCRVFICIAGMAAHLPGVVASLTTKPVIGVPVSGGPLDGMDALLSIVQMPRGIPVACVAIDGGTNAAILACEIIATDPQWYGLKDEIEHMRARAREV